VPKTNNTVEERLVAAVDLGSNSFHMTVAKLTPSGVQILIRDRERVRLAAGLNHKNVLDKRSIALGVEALARFDARLSGVATDDIRVVATHTLREARNADEFIDRASKHFRAPIEVISGPEEARLIFQAVAHTQSIDGRFLVFDVGGGSTEFAVGHDYDSEFLSSRTLGCVTFTNRYMQKVNKKAFAEIDLATRKAIEPIASRIRAFNVEKCFGSSGSAKGVSALGNFLGFGSVITRESLEACKQFVMNDINRMTPDIPDVSPERMQVLPAGLGIIAALMDELRLGEIYFADAALREGVLYGMDDRLKASDIRERTALDLAKKYGIDRDQATRVRETVEQIFEVACTSWAMNADDKQMLVWATVLHEIGLQINYSGYHRHGAYIVMNTALPGFNREQQAVLGTLIRMHRKKLSSDLIPRLRYWSENRIIRLVRLIRIAYAMHVGRESNIPQFKVSVDQETITLHFDRQVFDSHPVMLMDLEEEVRKQRDAGYRLAIQ
jgi:exopolyphosphatase/guanosine-5'-triphosphate,3'-diphosphate pyrophosphatase